MGLHFVEKGECYTCGSNSFGQLGFPKTESNDLPYLVGSLEEKVFSHIACGDTFTVAVTTGKEAFVNWRFFLTVESLLKRFSNQY